MLDAGSSLESVRRISGHSARVIAMRYAHATDSTVRAAVSALDQFADQNVTLFLHGGGQEMQPKQPMRHPAPVGKGRKTKGNSKKSVKARLGRA